MRWSRRGARRRAAALAVAGVALWLVKNPGTSQTARAAPAGADLVSAAQLYRFYCQRCHGADGRGDRQRGTPAGLPDFTRRDWQERHSDVQLTVSILEGKGGEMPDYRDRLTDRQVAALVAHIRAFVPVEARAAPRPEVPARAADPGVPTTPALNFNAEFRRLEQEFEDLRRQLRELSAPPRQPAAPPGQPAGRGRRRAGRGLTRRHKPGRLAPDEPGLTGPRGARFPAAAGRGWFRR
jgi:mono/diheme cytochrome c family protein